MIISFHVRDDEAQGWRAKLLKIRHEKGFKSQSQTIRYCIEKAYCELTGVESDYITLSKSDFSIIIRSEAIKLLEKAFKTVEKNRRNK